jgi:hypothetical protein
MNREKALNLTVNKICSYFEFDLKNISKEKQKRTFLRTPYKMRCDNILTWSTLHIFLKGNFSEFLRFKNTHMFFDLLDEKLKKKGIHVVDPKEAMMKYEFRGKLYQKRGDK